MSKPNYRVNLSYDSDRKVFMARAPELEHCSGEGATRAEAIQRLEEEIDAQLANMLSHGTTPPRAVDEETWSGELTARVSKSLHRDLIWAARNEGIDIGQLVGELLAAAVESRRGSRGPRSGNQRQPGQQHEGRGGNGRGTQFLDDRANFMEYVRSLDGGGGGQGGGHHGGHGGHGGGHGQHRGGGQNRGGGRHRGDRDRGPNRHNDRHQGQRHGGNGHSAAAPPPPSDGDSET
jgi:predicted RNase H-like HicB family nuclease